MLNSDIVFDILEKFVHDFPGVDLNTPFGQYALADFLADNYPESEPVSALRKYVAHTTYATNGMDPNINGLKQALRIVNDA